MKAIARLRTLARQLRPRQAVVSSPAEKAVRDLRRMTSWEQRKRLRVLHRELVPSATGAVDNDDVTDLIDWLTVPAVLIAADLITRGDERGHELLALRMCFVLRSDDADAGPRGSRSVPALPWRHWRDSSRVRREPRGDARAPPMTRLPRTKANESD